MKPLPLLSVTVAFAILLCPTSFAEGKGSIDGQVTRADGIELAGVTVVIAGASLFALTDDEGRFEFRGIRAGSYTLTFSLLDNSITRPDVVVTARSTVTIDQTVDWQVGYLETVTVQGVSRRRERIVEAPAAVTTLAAEEMGPQASHGLTPKLLEFTPGVSITQINVAEFLVETRGFNGGLNRRVPLLVDGRDLTDPFIGATEWPVVSYAIDDFAELDLIRGPASALYGANATGGLVNITTKAPRDSQGGMIRLTGGELDSVNAEFRWAGGLGRGWYMKAQAGERVSKGYSVSRNETTEYSQFCTAPGESNCLQQESMPLPKDKVDIAYGNLRFDKHMANGGVFTIEGGTTSYDGNVFLSLPRGQIQDVKRPWARFNYSSERWNVFAYWSNRDAEAVNLGSGAPFLMEGDNFRVEFQTNRSFAGNKVQLVAGGSLFTESVDSNIMVEKVDNDEQAIFAQVDWLPHARWKLVGALRWDNSTLFNARVSPKASVVYNVNARHALRLTYNEAFQVPTYGEYFLLGSFAQVDTSGLNQICVDYAGVDCGLGAGSPASYSGNQSLELEQVKTLELGYKGVLGSKSLLTIDLYETRNDNFVTPLIAQLGANGERTNPNFGAWAGPEAAENTAIDPANCPVAVAPGGSVADCVRATAPSTPFGPTTLGALGWQLTNFRSESIVLSLSNTTFGEVDTRGAEVGFQHFVNDQVSLFANYAWFDFEVVEGVPGLETVLGPNTPENRASLGCSYAGGRWNASLRGRWVDSFHWYGSTTDGEVEAYVTADLNGNYTVNKHWRVGLNVANVFDEQHWEAWGSDLIGRRALLHVTFAW